MAEDSLALSLERSASDPAHRAQFRKDLLAATIYVMGEIEGEDPTKRSKVDLKAGKKVSLRSQLTGDGRTIVPFFSSLEKLQGFIQGNDQVKYLAIPTRTLFDVAKGAILVLNSGSRVVGEFKPEDIAMILQLADAPPNKRN